MLPNSRDYFNSIKLTRFCFVLFRVNLQNLIRVNVQGRESRGSDAVLLTSGPSTLIRRNGAFMILTQANRRNWRRRGGILPAEPLSMLSLLINAGDNFGRSSPIHYRKERRCVMIYTVCSLLKL